MQCWGDFEESLEKIEQCTAGMSYEEFYNNEMAVDAILRNLEIIGEAVKISAVASPFNVRANPSAI